MSTKDLMDRMKKIGSIADTNILSESSFFNEKDMIVTDVPALNIALSGSMQGGLVPGLTVLAGESRTFKTNMGLKCVAAYQNKYPDSICLFYDSEFGATPEYLKGMGVDIDRMLHLPIVDIELLKFDISKKLAELKRGDKVIIFIDSIGNLASKKEVEDAENEKSVADMTRSKQLKSFFRIVTPHLTTKDIPMIVINHTYKTLELYSKNVISGGTGVMYSANTAFIITRAQEKDKDNELEGYTFTINIEKSRFVKEKSKVPLTVKFDSGIDKYSGLLDIALEGQFIVQPTKQTYQLVGETEAVKKKGVEPLLEKLISMPEFNEYIKKTYRLSAPSLETPTSDEEE